MYIYIYIYEVRALIPVRNLLLPAPQVRGRETSECRHPDATGSCMSPHVVAWIVKSPPPPFLLLAHRTSRPRHFLPKVQRSWAGRRSLAWFVMCCGLLKPSPPKHPSPDVPASPYGQVLGWNFNRNGSGSVFSRDVCTKKPVYGGGKLCEKSFEKVTGEGNFLFGGS